VRATSTKPAGYTNVGLHRGCEHAVKEAAEGEGSLSPVRMTRPQISRAPPAESDSFSASTEPATLERRPKSDSLPIRERFGVTVAVAAEFIGISRSRIYELLADGTLDGRVIRGRRIVIVSSMMRMLGEAPSTKREMA
jgi:hypothetical protein